jgi:SPX domain protein involved in polyphosphate accumulation
VDFDLALSVTPLGSRGSRATYWIHPDHIVEVEVLLLQHMRLHAGSNANASPLLDDSPIATPSRRKSSTTVDKYLNNEDNVGLIVLDNPESFAKKQNASTIGSNEEATGVPQVKAAGNARWSSSGDAVVAVGLKTDQDVQDLEQIKVVKMKRKYVEAFLGGSEEANQATDSPHSGAQVQKWLAEHEDIKPIADIFSKRTRFVGLHNGQSGGMWATLDTQILVKNPLPKDLKSNERFSDAHVDATSFPHAVLEVRRENNQSAALIQTLDNSHLVRSSLHSSGNFLVNNPPGRTCTRFLFGSTRRVDMP